MNIPTNEQTIAIAPGSAVAAVSRPAEVRLKPSVTVATVTLGFNLTSSGLLTAATALPGAIAMVCSFIGMFVGQAVRTRLQPEVFRRWFHIGMILLGAYLALSTILKIES